MLHNIDNSMKQIQFKLQAFHVVVQCKYAHVIILTIVKQCHLLLGIFIIKLLLLKNAILLLLH